MRNVAAKKVKIKHWEIVKCPKKHKLFKRLRTKPRKFIKHPKIKISVSFISLTHYHIVWWMRVNHRRYRKTQFTVRIMRNKSSRVCEAHMVIWKNGYLFQVNVKGWIGIVYFRKKRCIYVIFYQTHIIEVPGLVWHMRMHRKQ